MVTRRTDTMVEGYFQDERGILQSVTDYRDGVQHEHKITCFGYKSDYWASEIKRKKCDLKQREDDCLKVSKELQQLRLDNPGLVGPEIKAIDGEIHSMTERVQKLKQRYFDTVQQAEEEARRMAEKEEDE